MNILILVTGAVFLHANSSLQEEKCHVLPVEGKVAFLRRSGGLPDREYSVSWFHQILGSLQKQMMASRQAVRSPVWDRVYSIRYCPGKSVSQVVERPSEPGLPAVR
jgi:hypothetical protein